MEQQHLILHIRQLNTHVKALTKLFDHYLQGTSSTDTHRMYLKQQRGCIYEMIKEGINLPMNLNCPICGIHFQNRTSMCMHLITMHSKFKWYNCHICGSNYRLFGSLKTHLQVHNGVEMHLDEDVFKVHVNEGIMQLRESLY